MHSQTTLKTSDTLLPQEQTGFRLEEPTQMKISQSSEEIENI